MATQGVRSYLEQQADRLEATANAHRTPVRVIGGTAGPRVIRFIIEAAPHVRYAAIQALQDDIALALRVPDVSLQRSEEGIVVEFANPEQRRVDLAEMLTDIESAPASSALLGQTTDGSQLLIRLSSPEVAHVLVAGTTGSGKTVLLRAMLVSLVLHHRPDELRLVCIDPKKRAFGVFEGLPHLTRAPLCEGREMREALRSLVRLMELRDQRGESAPMIVVAIDELTDLVMQVEDTEKLLTRLVQRGREAGIHLVAATQRPSAAILSGLMRANFPLRLVGRVVTAEDARIASGRSGSNAHLLQGRGDFLAVGGEQAQRFQAAYADETQLAALLQNVRRQAPSADVLPDVAEDAESRPRLDAGVETLLANWEWWSRSRTQWGAKRQLHELLFPGKPYGGAFIEQAQQIVAAAERIAGEGGLTTTTTTTTDAQARLPLELPAVG